MLDDRLFSIRDRRFLIAGGAGAIGRAIVAGLRERGASVAVFDRSSCPEASLSIAGDVTDAAAVDRAVAQVKDGLGGIDVLLSLAGVNVRGEALSLPEQAFDEVMAVNAKGTFLIGQAVGRVMVAQGHGSIINMASIAGQYGVRGASAYSAAKAAVIQLTRAWAAEWGAAGVRVNAIAPTAVRTPMMAEALADPARAAALIGRIPLGRVMEPEDLLGTVIYLASAASSFVTGHVLVVDGGRTATI